MTMNRRRIYIVVNEGASERTYLQSLRSFLANRMPLGDDFCPRLDLIPRVTNGGIGGGAFPLVRKTYRMCRQADRHTPIVIWVDADIYVRNATADERHNAEAYSKKVMMRHASDTRMQALFRANTSAQTFAEFLTNCLRELYPETFGGVNPLWFGSVNVDNDSSHDMEAIRKSIAQGLDSDSDGD